MFLKKSTSLMQERIALFLIVTFITFAICLYYSPYNDSYVPAYLSAFLLPLGTLMIVSSLVVYPWKFRANALHINCEECVHIINRNPVSAGVVYASYRGKRIRFEYYTNEKGTVDCTNTHVYNNDTWTLSDSQIRLIKAFARKMEEYCKKRKKNN